jgi:hypothetical protein
MDDMWKKLIRAKLTPNQFYMLHAIREGVSTPLLNTAMEYRVLKNKNWILEDGTLSAKATKIIKEIEAYFKRLKAKTDASIMGKDFEEKLIFYNDLWPKKKLPTGKAARSAKGNLIDPFRWFHSNYEFGWELVMKATALYLDEKEADNWNYCRTSQYFIRKQSSDKSWSSELADYCQLIEDGADTEPKLKSDKVF